MKCPPFEELVSVAFATVTKQESEVDSLSCREHVETCPSCAEQLNSLLEVIRGVRRVLTVAAKEGGGGPCLDDNRLAAYFDGAVEGEERDQSEAHLVSCDECFTKLLDLSEAMKGIPKERVSSLRYVLRLAKKGMELALHPEEGFAWVKQEPAVAMGPNDKNKDERRSWSWTQASGDFVILFSAIQIDDLHVDLSLCVEHKPFPVKGVRLFLKSHHRLLQSELLSDAGKVELRHLETGAYDLELLPLHGEALTLNFDIQ